MLRRDLEAAEKKLEQQTTAAQEAEKWVAQLQRESDDATSQLAEAQENCRNLEAAAKGNVP